MHFPQLNSPRLKQTWPFHLMLLPGIILIVIFSYMPMVGITIAFQDFIPTKGFFGSPWVGLNNFKFMLNLPDTYAAIRNTVIIAVLKIITGLIVPVVFALLLNEIRSKVVKRSIQTMVYFPHFLSWVILASILKDVLSMKGQLNQVIGIIGIQPIFFLGDQDWFRVVLVVSNLWKEFGFSAIVYLAALSSIDPTLYEASMIDGANRWKQTLHVTIPGIVPVVILMASLSLGDVLNAGFDQVFNLYNALVYSSGDIIDTLVYRVGLVNTQYGVATAMGLFKSIVGFAFVALSYWSANRFANYRIF